MDSKWLTVRISLLCFFTIMILFGIGSVLTYIHFQSKGNVYLCPNSIALFVICQGVAIWMAAVIQKTVIRKIFKKKDYQLEGDKRIFMMNNRLSNWLLVFSVVFLVLDCVFKLFGIPIILWAVFLFISIIVVNISCKQKKISLPDGNVDFIEFNDLEFVIQRNIITAGLWLFALVCDKVV